MRGGLTTDKEAAYDPRGEVRQGQYHFLWPNCTININPGRPNLSVDVWLPDGPGRTRGLTDYFFGEDVGDDLAREMIAFDDQVGQEDVALVESVQRGLSSGLLPHGRLLLSSEHLIHRFQRQVFEALVG